jgi:hypothetical protein
LGAAIGSETQQRVFRDRLTRIKAGGENTTRHVYFGPVDETETGRRSRRRIRRVASLRGGSRRSFLAEMLIVPGALAFGGLAVVAARAVGFHFLADQPLYAEYAWYADVGLALVIALILRWSLKLSGGVRGKAFLAGFVVMVLFQALFVVRAPELFETLYSERYVADIMARIDPA